jgi:2-oxoglutarate dehydrogenase E1 component
VSRNLQQLVDTSHLFGGNAAFVESLYEQWLSDPDTVPDHWRGYFEELNGGQPDVAHGPIRDELARAARSDGIGATTASTGSASAEFAEKQANVLRLINAYRVRGHQRSRLDPLELTERPPVADLEPGFHHLSDADLETVFNTGSLHGTQEMRLREILTLLERTYCGPIGYEYMHITDTNQRRWLQERIESAAGHYVFDREDQLTLLQQLTAAEGLEKYLHKKYVGQKRFSLEGSESLIPLLHDMIQRAGSQGVREIVMGMAHRGRLNVLVNVLGKSPKELFEEFEGKADYDNGGSMGDVKYHLGFSSDVQTPGGPMHLALAFNPSHLEIIDPVVAGSVRARQTRRGDLARTQVLPIVMHGDAAFAGQGVVMETFNMSQARGFYIGGTIHIIINNQIGFTTSNPLDARSTLYCTEVAKMVQAPVFHVNADNPEAVLFAARTAMDFRRTFKKDVVIDLICYRRHGHNEADEPSVTQPRMYRQVRKQSSTTTIYSNNLLEQGIIKEKEVKQYADEYRDALDQGKPVAEILPENTGDEFAVDWQPYLNGDLEQEVDTTVPVDRIQELSSRLTTLPDGFNLHSRVERIVSDRRKMAQGEQRMDWGFAETMAYATLLEDGWKVRLTGQDSVRGTFFHRHATLHDQETGDTHTPLQEITPNPYDFTIIDSLLSEEAVVGFEYGYATAEPEALVIWEAQFGDFVNGAQVVIDQFISSGEAKWGRLCGLAMFLPHGYEGQGPEHSSARLERFLQLCAQYNMQVCVPTTPAQMFHMLRRQMLRSTRKPLIVLTPKSLLRHKASTSTLEDLAEGRFHLLIEEESEAIASKEVTRVVACTGKVYYDLLKKRDEMEANVPIIRVEQLYPFPREDFKAALKRYPKAKEVVWCQEEPMNQGVWYQAKHHFQYCIRRGQRLMYAGRPRSPSPATGYPAVHKRQQEGLVEDALTSGKGVELEVE